MQITLLRAAPEYALPNSALIAGSALVYGKALGGAVATFPFDPARDLLPEETNGRLRRRVRDGKLDFAIPGIVQNVGHLTQDATPLNLMYPSNYFHFLIETLPSLIALIERRTVTEDSIIVSGLLHLNMLAALKYALGPLDLPILQLRPMQAVTCDRVVTAPPTWHATHLVAGGISDSEFNPENLRLVRRRFAPLWETSLKAPTQKIFVRRVSQLRNVINAEEVERLAQEAGYRIVQPEHLSFFEQVELFSSASHIMGPTGAWAANLLFAPEAAQVVVFCPEATKTERNIWVGLGEPFGLKVDILYCPIPKALERFPIHSDFVIQPEELKARLHL